MSIGMNRSDRGKRFVSLILPALIINVVLLLPILGCLAGGWYGVAWNRGSVISWKRLEPLPQKATHILAAGTGLSNYSWVVYVKTTNQKVYSCSPEACWLEKTVVPEELLASPPCDRPAHFEVPSPPGRVVDSIETQACHPEAAYQVNFAVLEDGSVWRWQHFVTASSLLLYLLVSTVCGSMLGLFGSLVIAVSILLRNKRKQEH